MGPLDALWHLLNFAAPALTLGALAAALAKIVWRRDLAAVRWWPLAAWTAAVCLGVAVAGLVIGGRDGRMATYGAMVAAAALTLWWRGFVRR